MSPGARSKFGFPHVRTWGLLEKFLLYWTKYLWHRWDFSAPLAVIRRPENCTPLPPLPLLRPCLPFQFMINKLCKPRTHNNNSKSGASSIFIARISTEITKVTSSQEVFHAREVTCFRVIKTHTSTPFRVTLQRNGPQPVACVTPLPVHEQLASHARSLASDEVYGVCFRNRGRIQIPLSNITRGCVSQTDVVLHKFSKIAVALCPRWP